VTCSAGTASHHTLHEMHAATTGTGTWGVEKWRRLVASFVKSLVADVIPRAIQAVQHPKAFMVVLVAIHMLLQAVIGRRRRNVRIPPPRTVHFPFRTLRFLPGFVCGRTRVAHHVLDVVVDAKSTGFLVATTELG
jgi:hypothetical protein